jgi:hypothetical protein
VASPYSRPASLDAPASSHTPPPRWCTQSITPRNVSKPYWPVPRTMPESFTPRSMQNTSAAMIWRCTYGSLVGTNQSALCTSSWFGKAARICSVNSAMYRRQFVSVIVVPVRGSCGGTASPLPSDTRSMRMLTSSMKSPR